MGKNLEEIIINIFNDNFTSYDFYEKSDESGVMVEKLLEKIDIAIDDIYINKLTRQDKEFITDLDRRESRITVDLLERKFADLTISYILIDIFNTLSEGKSIKRKVKKWFKEV
jgi:hypothetical protein